MANGFLPYLPLLLSASAMAECPTVQRGEPLPDAGRIAENLTCAANNDFRLSCAYRNWKKGEVAKSAPETAKEWSKKIGKIFDSSAPLDTNDDDIRVLQNALKDPQFFEIFGVWNDSAVGRPGKTKGRSHDSLRSAFSADQLERFYAAMDVLYAKDSSLNRYREPRKKGEYGGAALDPTGSLAGALELMAQLPPDARQGTPEQKKNLLEAIYLKGLLYQADRSAGCEQFSVESEEILGGFENYGPRGKRGGKLPEDVAAGKIAKDKTIQETDKFRSLEGAANTLQSCGRVKSAIRHEAGAILPSCDVNLPMQIFSDNVAKLPSDKEKQLVEALEKDACYQKSIREGLKINRVAIATSSNSLHNTKNYCRWEFDRLSADRAESIKTALKGHFGNALSDRQYVKNDRGENGDGTSGDCAYVAKVWEKSGSAPENAYEVTEVINGKKTTKYFTEVRKPEFMGPGEAQLDRYKYAKATLYFENKVNTEESKDQQWSSAANCTELKFSCQ